MDFFLRSGHRNALWGLAPRHIETKREWPYQIIPRTKPEPVNPTPVILRRKVVLTSFNSQVSSNLSLEIYKKSLLNREINSILSSSFLTVVVSDDIPKVIVLPVPVPVPVFVPVPMNLYTQYVPHTVGLPLPVHHSSVFLTPTEYWCMGRMTSTKTVFI